MKTIVVALGGNALGKTPNEQKNLVKKTAENIVDLIANGYKVIITHGNGPQVGMINLAFEYASKNSITCEMPFAECGAMSEGYIGYHLQQAIEVELYKRNMRRNCVSLVTQVKVDPNDSAFKNPTKPIGSFYTKEEADKISKDTKYVFKEDAGRGYRRVVPSPMPIKVLELNIIKKLMKGNNVIIAGGGGGIPVMELNHSLIGVDAVIDKDKTSALIASELKADILLILTAVDKVCINYNTTSEIKIDKMTINEAQNYLKNNEFASGSMKPKIEACLMFLKKNPRGKAIITSLNNAKKALNGKTGTIIKR